MALGRVVQLSAGSDGSGLLISGLDVDFSVGKTITAAQNHAEFTIYNAMESTRNTILRKGNNIILSLGYEDEAVANVFVGNITKSFSEKISSDWVTKVKAFTVRSKTSALTAIPITLAYTPGTPLTQPLSALADASGLILTAALSLSSIKLANGWVYAGTFMGAFRYIKDILDVNNMGMYIDNNEIVVYNIGEASRYQIVRLTYSGGLLSIRDISKTEETRKRIEFTSIIIPQIRVNGLVNVIGTPVNDGAYIVDKLKISGNNYGGAFKMVGEALL